MTPEMARADDYTVAGGYWSPGQQVLWRYRGNGTQRLHICRPVTVVRDTPELLAVWMAPGTECVRPVFDDGSAISNEPLATRYRRTRTTARSIWRGTGVLKLARAGEPWSVWLFWSPGWKFRNWYVNFEEPRLRWPGGIDSEDNFLDIAVYPDRSWRWCDEDEFAAAEEAGLIDAGRVEQVRAAGRRAIKVIKEWGSPFRDEWEDWRPEPSWTAPPLPPDWDRDPFTGSDNPSWQHMDAIQ